MPLRLPDDDSDQFFIVGKDTSGAVGAQLAAGASIAVLSGDPATVAVALDPTPQPTPVAGALADGTPVPAGTPTVASGTVTSPANPAQPGTAINITAQITNADGSKGDSAADTVTVVPGQEKALGVLFGIPAAVQTGTAPAAKKKTS